MFDASEQGFHPAASPSLCLNAMIHLPIWRARAAAAEQSRRLPKSTFAELFAGGWLNLLSPQAPLTESGHWPTLVESARIAARACASTGWMLALVGGHGCIARRLSPTHQTHLYAEGPRQLFASASSSPDSKLCWEASGIRVNGRWRFSSGIEDAAWLILNAPCPSHPQALDIPRFLILISAKEIECLTSWDSCGMAATGSHDVVTNQLLVAHDHVFSLQDVFSGQLSSFETDYIDRQPLIPYLTTSIIGPLLGCAEGAYEAFVESLFGTPLAGDLRIHERLSHSAAQLYTARLLYQALITRLHNAGVEGRPLNDKQMLILRRDRSYLSHLCVTTVRHLVERAGASSLIAGNPLQRHWRDIQAIAAHRDVAWNEPMSACGAIVLDRISDD